MILRQKFASFRPISVMYTKERQVIDLFFLGTTMPSTAVIVVSPRIREEMNIIAMFIPLGSEIEYARFALAFPFPLAIRSLAFEYLLTLTTTPYANDWTPPKICHVFNINLQPVLNNVAALSNFHFAR